MKETKLFSHDSEVMLLSLIFKNPDRIYDVMENVSPQVFLTDTHSAIFSGMMELARSETTINPHILKTYLREKNKISDAGGSDYIDMVASRAGEIDESGFDIYLKSVVDSYKADTLLKVAEKIPNFVHNSNKDMGQVVSSLVQKLQSLESGNLVHGVSSLQQLLNQTWDTIIERTKNPGIAGVTTGFPTIDKATGGYEPGAWWIICGRTGHGKTTALIKSLKEVAQAGVPTLLFSKEMQGTKLTERLLSMETGVPHEKLKLGTLTSKDKETLKEGYDRIKDIPLYIDSNFYGDENYISSVVRKYKSLYNIEVVGIDYIQLISQRGADQTHELGRISRMMKLLAEDLGITIIAASQLNRGVEHRENKRPILSDLRQSGNLEEDADVVVGLYRDELYYKNPSTEGEIEFIILKQRNGPLGFYTLGFSGANINIVDRAERDFKFDKGE